MSPPAQSAVLFGAIFDVSTQLDHATFYGSDASGARFDGQAPMHYELRRMTTMRRRGPMPE